MSRLLDRWFGRDARVLAQSLHSVAMLSGAAIPFSLWTDLEPKPEEVDPVERVLERH
jgi:hypothetical protein